MATDTRPSRAQSDTDILAALELTATTWGVTHRLDRTNSYRIVVISTDPAGAEGIEGVAVLERTADGYAWYLGCDGCEAELHPTDGGLCPSCRDFLAMQDA